MIRIAAKPLKAARNVSTFSSLRPPPPPRLFSRFYTAENSFKANPVAVQMINYALSLARSQKSDDSYGQSLLVLEQCLSTQSDENSKGMVLLAMSSLYSERGNFEEAIENLERIQNLNLSSIAFKVAASEALVGLHLELGQDDTSSVIADMCLQLLETIRLEIGGGYGFDVLEARAKALKGLVEMIHGNVESAESFFQGVRNDKSCFGNVALSYGGFLHGMRNFELAREVYQKVIQGISENKDPTHSQSIAACNMTMEEVLIAATCALGQLEAHVGNFSHAEEMLTASLKESEKYHGPKHPKVGVILTCIALMFRHKATAERSSSLLIQEGLFRRAIELLGAPPLESEGAEVKLPRRDIAAIARGGYAEILCVQQNRKAEGERMKHWAEREWKNRRLSLAEAIELSESSPKVPVIDTRISRAL